jgi:hypothetical protein
MEQGLPGAGEVYGTPLSGSLPPGLPGRWGGKSLWVLLQKLCCHVAEMAILQQKDKRGV